MVPPTSTAEAGHAAVVPDPRPAYATPVGSAAPPAAGNAFRQHQLQASRPLIRASFYLRCKPFVDRAAAAALAVLLLPVLAATAVLVKLTSNGPAFYAQTRLGRFAHPFRILKFRSMTHNVESKSGVRWASRNDSRVTPIGKFLRITHLDELPQLANILRGDMSLVGPRPERPEFIPVLEKTVHNYRLRMLVKPGVSGMAQVYLPPDADIGSVQKKIVYDLYYIRHLSFWLDLRLLIATPLQAMGIPCRLVRTALFLPSAERIEAEPMLPPLFEMLFRQEANGGNTISQTPTLPDAEPYKLSDSKFGTSVAV